jgi:hypothetical protein
VFQAEFAQPFCADCFKGVLEPTQRDLDELLAL